MVSSESVPSTGRVLAVSLLGALFGVALWAAAAASTQLQSGAWSMLVAGAVILAVRRFATPLRDPVRAALLAGIATLLGCALSLLVSSSAMFAVSHDVSVVRVFEALSVSYLLDATGRFLGWYDAAFVLTSVVLAGLFVAGAPGVDDAA